MPSYLFSFLTLLCYFFLFKSYFSASCKIVTLCFLICILYFSLLLIFLFSLLALILSNNLFFFLYLTPFKSLLSFFFFSLNNTNVYLCTRIFFLYYSLFLLFYFYTHTKCFYLLYLYFLYSILCIFYILCFLTSLLPFKLEPSLYRKILTFSLL